MPNLLPESVNLNIPGNWNRAILTPDWLRAQFPAAIPESQYELIFFQNLPIFPLGYKFERFSIEPADNRLLLKPARIDEDHLDFVSNLAVYICETLTHTPIFAVGHNVHFQLSDLESFAVDQFSNSESEKEFFNFLQLPLSRKSQQYGFSLEDHNLNIIYEEKAGSSVISFNFHYGSTSKEAILSAIRSFKNNIYRAIQLVEKLVK